jgi:hypothetical protein
LNQCEGFMPSDPPNSRENLPFQTPKSWEMLWIWRIFPIWGFLKIGGSPRSMGFNTKMVKCWMVLGYPPWLWKPPYYIH